jgi:hypothetical protein
MCNNNILTNEDKWLAKYTPIVNIIRNNNLYTSP